MMKQVNSHVDRHQKLRNLSYVTLILSVILIVFILVNRQHRQQMMVKAETVVQSLFVDDGFNFLRPEIDQISWIRNKATGKFIKNWTWTRIPVQ